MATAEPRIVLPDESAPTILPLLPQTGGVLFAGMIPPALLEDEPGRTLIEAVADGDRRLAVVARRDPPAHARDLHRIGVDARLLRMLRQPDGRLSVLLQGTARVEVVLVVQDAPYLRARLVPVAEQPAPAPAGRRSRPCSSPPTPTP